MTQETLSEALDLARQSVEDYRAVLVDPDAISEAYCYGGMQRDEVKRASFELVSLKGKKTRKWFTMVITRLTNGRYELVSYVL